MQKRNIIFIMKTLQEQYNTEVAPRMQKEFKYASRFAVPRITKVSVNVGIGKIRDNKDIVNLVEKHLTLIVGQKPCAREAKKAISSFKTRKCMVIGYSATLRGRRMYDFLNRWIHYAIPRMRDFRGIPIKSVDGAGNLTFGMREHIVFPEMISEDIRTIFGLEIT